MYTRIQLRVHITCAWNENASAHYAAIARKMVLVDVESPAATDELVRLEREQRRRPPLFERAKALAALASSATATATEEASVAPTTTANAAATATATEATDVPEPAVARTSASVTVQQGHEQERQRELALPMPSSRTLDKQLLQAI